MASEHHKLQAGHKLKKSSLDKDLSKIARVEDAARAISMSVISLGAGLVFLAAAGLIAATQVTGDASGALIVVAAILGEARR